MSLKANQKMNMKSNPLSDKMNSLSTEMLKDVCVKAMGDARKECDMILSIGLDILEIRLSESDFVAFCETL